MVKPPAHLGAHHSLARALRRGKFAGGAKVEPRYRKLAIEAELAGKPPKSRSEKSRSAWRNDPKRDEKIFSFINVLLRKKQPVRLTNTATDLVWEARKKLKEAMLDERRIVPDIGIPHWDHASDLLKMIGWGMASKELRAQPFTLRLSAAVIEAASRDKRGFGRHIQDRIARHLRQRFPTGEATFWFAVEQGFREEPHVHGAVVVPEEGLFLTREALRAAGGKWRSDARQCDIRPRLNQIKWVGYATKWLFGSKAKIRSANLIGATQTMRRTARTAYQSARTKRTVLYP